MVGMISCAFIYLYVVTWIAWHDVGIFSPGIGRNVVSVVVCSPKLL